jgi:N-acyl-D-amino-acid deacylase
MEPLADLLAGRGGHPSDVLAIFGLDELDWAADVFVADLPEGAQRLRRPAGGYRYTVVGGTVVQAGGELTGARPRGVQRSGR